MENKIKDQENYIAEYNKAIEQGEKLLAGLLQYDKNTINKTFFEKYFTLTYTKEMLANGNNSDNHKVGDARKDWKGNVYTDFKFSDNQYSFEKGKKIHLSGHYYISNITTTNRIELIEIVKTEITAICNHRDYAITKRDIYKNFDLINFKKEYQKLLQKYNGETINCDIIDEIRF